MRRTIKWLVLAGACFIFWNALSLDFYIASLAGAMGLSALAALFSQGVFYEHNPLRKAMVLYRLDLLFVYFLTVLIQSYAATFELIRRMLTRRYEPGIVRIRTKLRSGLGRVILANTISLVPGTLTLWMRDDHLYVHWFDRKTTHSQKAGRMIKQQIETYLDRIFG
jgi:multicomponent Na+:H+ antiporter subunit E